MLKLHAITIAALIFTATCVTGQNTDTLVVKGFYLGMPGSNVVQLINEKYLSVFKPATLLFRRYETTHPAGEEDNSFAFFELPGPWEEIPIKPISVQEGFRASSGYTSYTVTYDRVILFNNMILMGTLLSAWADRFQLDPAGDLNHICWSSDQVDKLFNVRDLNWEAFAEKFVKSYNVPTLQYGLTEGDRWSAPISFLRYTSPSGYELTIFEDKYLRLRSVPKQSERAFD